MKIKLHSIVFYGLLLSTLAASRYSTARTARVSASDERWETGGSYAGYKPEQEVLERRTKYAKHFRNPNGTFTVQTGKVYHYKDDKGAWQDIDLKVTPTTKNGFGYANETNEIKSYFPVTPGKGIEMKLSDKVTFNWWQFPDLTTKLNLTNNAGPQWVALEDDHVNGVANGAKLIYPSVHYGISEEFVTLQNGIENNTIIHSLTSRIANQPANTNLEFRQFIPLKKDWNIDVNGVSKTTDFTATDFHIAIPGTEMGIFFSPIIAFDHSLTQQEALYVKYAPENKLTAAEKEQKAKNILQCNYEVKFVAGGIWLTTLMPADWLKETGRSFPVTIDPTVTISPSPLVSGGSFYGPMTHWYGFQRHADLYLASELGISNVNITDIEYQRMNTSGTNAVKPAKVYMRTTTATTVTGTNAWNSTTYTGGLTPLYDNSADFHGTTIGWKMISLTTPFLYASDNLMVMVYDAYASSGSAKYLDQSTSFATNRQAYFRQDNTDPGDATPTSVETKLTEIRITYSIAAPPNCVATPLNPANGATTVCSGPITLRWNSVAGATGYDVYFNSGTTATALVATNQPDTFYNATSTLGANAWKIVPKNTTGAATGCNTFTFTTITGTTATATITVSPNDTLCPGVPVTFTATNTNGGTAPSYQWKKNNLNVGTNSPTYISNGVVNNDAVKVVMTSNSTACLTSPTATSNTITMTTLPTPGTTITASGPTRFCFGGSVTLSVPAGAASYQWRNLSGNISGATGNSYVALYGDTYSVTASSAGNCSAVSDTMSVVAYQLPYPHLVITGTTLSVAPYYVSYQWYNSTTPIAGATTNSYTYTADGTYSVQVTDTLGCSGRSFALPINTTGVGSVVNSGYAVYPNPSTGLVNIVAPVPVDILIRSVDGKVVMTKNNVKQFDISALASGVYMLYLNNSSGQLIGIQKLVKQAD